MSIADEIRDTKYYKYAENVVSGKQVAGELIKLACERFLADCERSDLYFNKKKVDKFFKFCSLFRHYKTTDCDSLGKNFVLEPWQQWVMANLIGFHYVATGKRRFNTAMLCLSRKQGKAIDINTPIPTPDGYKTMGEIEVGDVVWGGDGKPTKVTYVTDVMYNHNCYKVTFEDDETIIADAEHNWLVKRNGVKKSELHVETTEQIYNSKYFRHRRDGKGIEYQVRVPMNKPVESQNIELPMDPYTLGCWLADGSSRDPRITTWTEDIELFDRVSNIYGEPKLYYDKRTNAVTLSYTGEHSKNNSRLRHDLDNLNLINNKHIPEIFLRAGTQQRLELLQGFMDCDGACCSRGECEFQQKNVSITDGICEILSSLGIKYSRTEKIPTINGFPKDKVQRVQFFTDKTLPCFTLPRKYNRLKDRLNKRMDYKSIRKIEPVESVPVKCLTVDNESHTYCCGKHYTVTHNTALAAVICLWFLFDEAGASVGLAANSRSQSSLAFDFVSKFASQIDPKQKDIRRYRNSLKCDANAGELKVFAADATRLDGENLSFALIDEYHAAKDNSVYAVLRSSMTSRPNPLILVITTVGFNLVGPMKKMYDTDIEILHGLKKDDNRFTAIYQMDQGDNWEDESNWIKHSPNLGVSVSYDNLRKAKTEAINNPATLNETLTKNWNVWCSVTECWIPDNYVLNCMTQKINLDDFRECECYVGVDLSCVSDMTAVSYVLRKEDDDRYYYYTDYYLPESCLTESPNRELYREWVNSRQLKLTPGNVVDYDYITNDIMTNYNRLNMQKIAYDQYNATSWAIKCTELGLPLYPYSQSLGNFNKPTKEFERQIRCKEAVIDKNEITLWMFRNVEIKQDWNGNAKPVKVHADKKIDGIISQIEALGCYLSVPHYSGSILAI